MNNTLFLTLELSNLLLFLSFSKRKRKSMVSRAILVISLKKSELKTTHNYLSGLSGALFPTTFLEIAVNARLS